MAIVVISGFLCERCSHKWVSRQNSRDIPIVCPKCKSPYWNIKKKVGKKGKIQIKNKIMGNLLYAIAVILVIIWAIGFLGYNAGGIIHVLLVIAVIAVILRVIQGKNPI